MKFQLLSTALLLSCLSQAQPCSCEKEFDHIRQVIETSSAGFPDYLKKTGKAAYAKKVAQFRQLSRSKYASDNCPLLIDQYLGLFNSKHLGFRNSFDAAKIDTAYAEQRPRRTISAAEIARLKKSRSWEGIYYFTHDSSYKIAVIRDKTPLHDYIGVLLESKLSHWKPGMIKFEGKLVNDSLLMGLLYVRNHRPKMEGFALNSQKEKISGDWRREGTVKPVLGAGTGSSGTRLPVLDAKTIDEKTFYLRIGSFDASLKPELDSMLKVHAAVMAMKPYLIIDLRFNGGGSDYLWGPLIPLLYTGPITYRGVDLLATETTINGWKEYLSFEGLDESAKTDIGSKIALMEKNKGSWVSMGNDNIDSSGKPRPFPQKIIILQNKFCGSSTEEFILAARQSSKVILAGENTTGNLDYSNVVETGFACFPYKLLYPSTRSRRVDHGQAIDNIGIEPHERIKEGADWIQEALRILGK